MKISNEVKSNNAKYTNECEEIYDNLHFAKITSKVLHNKTMFYVCCFWLLILCLALIIILLANDIKKDKLGIIMGLVIVSVCMIPFIIGIGVYIKWFKEKVGQPYYFIKINDSEYIISGREENEVLNMEIMVDFKQRKLLIYENNKCDFDMVEYTTIGDCTGFHQYTCNVNRVFDSKVVTSPVLRYKKKKQVKNKTIYYFRSVSNVFGTRYPRGLVLENNIVKEVCVQDLFPRQGSPKNGHITEMFKYYFVNDDSVKIHIPKKVLEEAKKNNFQMPFCDNIVYDD